MKILPPLFLAACIFSASWWTSLLWHNRNPLAKYGVSYEKTYGEHESYQTIYFYWQRNGKRVMGPVVNGDDLYLQFQHVASEEVPEIIVRSHDYGSNVAVFKLNFSDSQKPEFEMIQNHMMGVAYPKPWDDYYYTDPNTFELEPKRK